MNHLTNLDHPNNPNIKCLSPTINFRILKPTSTFSNTGDDCNQMQDGRLQQRWCDINTGEIEWLDIEIVYEDITPQKKT